MRQTHSSRRKHPQRYTQCPASPTAGYQSVTLGSKFALLCLAPRCLKQTRNHLSLASGPSVGPDTEGMGGAPKDGGGGAASAGPIVCRWLSSSFIKRLLFIGIFKSLRTQKSQLSMDWLLVGFIFCFSISDTFLTFCISDDQKQTKHLTFVWWPHSGSFGRFLLPTGGAVHCLI